MYCKVRDGDIEIQYVDGTYRVTLDKQTMIMDRKGFISLGRGIFKIVNTLIKMERKNG